jgi:hypothetical protein
LGTSACWKQPAVTVLGRSSPVRGVGVCAVVVVVGAEAKAKRAAAARVVASLRFMVFLSVVRLMTKNC